MNQEIIDEYICLTASCFADGLFEREIAETYIAAKFNMEDIALLLAAGKILYNDRKNAKPIKGSFRRIA